MIRIDSEFECEVKDVVVQKRTLVTPFFVKRLKAIEWHLEECDYVFGFIRIPSKGRAWFDGDKACKDENIEKKLRQANLTASNVVKIRKCK